MIHTIELSERFSVQGTGTYGVYYKLNSKCGVKVTKEFFSVEKIKEKFQKIIVSNYRDFWEKRMLNGSLHLVAEYLFLKRLAFTGLVPKPHNLTWVKRFGVQTLGIVMDHIEGSSVNVCEEINYFEKKFFKQAKKVGLHIFDWRPENVLVTKKGKIFRIDFTPKFVTVVKDKKVFVQNFKKECEMLIDAL